MPLQANYGAVSTRVSCSDCCTARRAVNEVNWIALIFDESKLEVPALLDLTMENIPPAPMAERTLNCLSCLLSLALLPFDPDIHVFAHDANLIG